MLTWYFHLQFWLPGWTQITAVEWPIRNSGLGNSQLGLFVREDKASDIARWLHQFWARQTCSNDTLLVAFQPKFSRSERSWLHRYQQERMSHYYTKTIAASQAKKQDSVFIRELLSHQLLSQGQHVHTHTHTHMHWGCSLAILFKRLVPYSSPLNEAVNLETWGPLQCSSESCYNDPGTELVN